MASSRTRLRLILICPKCQANRRAAQCIERSSGSRNDKDRSIRLCAWPMGSGAMDRLADRPVPLRQDHVPISLCFRHPNFQILVFNQPDWDILRRLFQLRARCSPGRLFSHATDPDWILQARKVSSIIWHGWADTALSGAKALSEFYPPGEAHDGIRDYCRSSLFPAVSLRRWFPGAADVDCFQ